MNAMNRFTRLTLFASCMALFCVGRSAAQTMDPLWGSSPDRISDIPFNLFSNGTGSDPTSEAAALAQQQATGTWTTGLGMPGVDGDVRAMVWKDGELFVGGDFITTGGITTNHIARWDGSRWQALGGEIINGVDGSVNSIAIDGNKVYVAGEFYRAGGMAARNIAMWDMSTNTWSSLGGGVGGVFGSAVNALAIHNGQVYAAGRFIAAGTTVSVNIARWDGSRWQRVGKGINDVVTALYVDGNMLYAAGNFTTAGNVGSPNLARFNLSSNTWESIGVGISGPVASMAADDRYLYIGGAFAAVGTTTVNNIARMDKSTGQWSAMGGGFKGGVRTILLRGNEVIAGGELRELVGQTMPRGYEVRRIAKWDGTKWSAFARRSALSGRNHGSSGVIKASRAESIDDPDVVVRDNGEGMVYTLALDNGGGLYIGGSFDVAGPAYVVPLLTPAAAQIVPDPEMIVATNICKLTQNDTVWTTIGGGLDNHVYAMADDGSHLYLGGRFLNAAENRVNRITRFDKEARKWEVLGNGVNDDVLALALDGTNLYVGGVFSSAGGNSANGLARWDVNARTWSRVGNSDFDSVSALAVVDGNLYVGGAHGLARWNGSAWTTVYDGANGPVAALVRDGGTLYVAGTFNNIGSVQAKNIAALNTANDQWSALGTGTNGPAYALSMWNGTLCVGGGFTQAGTVATKNIAVWNPQSGAWQGLKDGVEGEVRAITPGRFGLYVGGRFRTLTSGQGANSMALWNGTGWQVLSGGVLEFISIATVHALVANEDHLYVGGTHHYSGGNAAYYLARWNYPPTNGTVQENIPVQRQSAAPATVLGTVYPNPALDKGTFQLQLSQFTDLTADLFNAVGERVAAITAGSFDAGTHELTINTGALPEGIYFLRIVTGKESHATPFIVRH